MEKYSDTKLQSLCISKSLHLFTLDIQLLLGSVVQNPMNINSQIVNSQIIILNYFGFDQNL